MSNEIGSGPVQPEYEFVLKNVADYLEDYFHGQLPIGSKRTVGFVLMIFPFGQSEHHRCNYISNARREDIITMLKEQISYFEGMPDNIRGKA